MACCTRARLRASSAAAAWERARVEAGKGAWLHREGRQEGAAGGGDGRRRAALLVPRVGGRRRREKEEKGRRRKRKEKKEKGKKKEKKRERGKERAADAIRGGSQPRTRCDTQPVDDVHAEREKERRDRDWYWCRDSGSSGHDFGRLGARAEKDFGVI